MNTGKSFILGLVCGALLFSTSITYAAGVSAVKSPQEVFINGEKAVIEGYNVDGRNYYQLRELGKLMEFQVEYDRKTNRVQIYSGEYEKQNEPEIMVSESKEEEITVQAADVSVKYDQDGRPLMYRLNPGDILYGTGNVSKGDNPYAADEYDGYMTIKPYSKGVAFLTEPLQAINPAWDKSYYEITMPNPIPCYTHTLAGAPSEFMGMEVAGAEEQYDMYVFNAHETQRIIDKLYDTFLKHPECYTDGKLNCTVRVGLTGSGFDGNFFYPYQEHCVEQTVGDRNTDYMVYAVDTYTNGVYMGTKYCCIQNCTPDNPDVISSDTVIMKERQYK